MTGKTTLADIIGTAEFAAFRMSLGEDDGLRQRAGGGVTAPAPMPFHAVGRDQYRCACPSGRVYWITRRYAGTWHLRMAENEDAHEGDVIAEGRLNDCRRAASAHEDQLLAEERTEAP